MTLLDEAKGLPATIPLNRSRCEPYGPEMLTINALEQRLAIAVEGLRGAVRSIEMEGAAIDYANYLRALADALEVKP